MSLIIVNETVFIRSGDAVGWSIRRPTRPAAAAHPDRGATGGDGR